MRYILANTAQWYYFSRKVRHRGTFWKVGHVYFDSKLLKSLTRTMEMPKKYTTNKFDTFFKIAVLNIINACNKRML